ncbi:NAD(P)-binding domain-containing protein [soil metagenome]
MKSAGIAYDQLESEAHLGGNWRHGVYKNAHIISSRKTTEFPDYKMPANYPDFPSAEQMLAYLEDYAKHFQLKENIQFGCTVQKVQAVEEGWQVELADGSCRLYEGVVVCNGHHWERRWPSYPGNFSGEMMHSKDYKNPDQLKNKSVLVIGGGNSACDIAAEAARVGSSAHLSLRRGYWFLPKTIYGRPTTELLTTSMPVWMQRLYIRLLLKIVVGDYRNYGLMKPDHKIFDHHPTINTELLHYLKHGKITPHSDVKCFDGNTVEFVDGTKEKFDLIVCATGFNVSMPFLPAELVPIEGPVVKAFWGLVAPHHKQLYVYGWAQARYGFGPLLTPASQLLAKLIILQRRLKNPLGEVLEFAKQPLPTTHLIDPMDTLNLIKSANGMLWLLPSIDKYFLKNKK